MGHYRQEPSEAELKMLKLIASRGGRMSHDEPELNEFCDDNARLDVFNACSAKGWTDNTHDFWTDASTVFLTDAGKARVWDAANRN